MSTPAETRRRRTEDKEVVAFIKETAGFDQTEDEFEEDALEQQAMDEAEALPLVEEDGE